MSLQPTLDELEQLELRHEARLQEIRHEIAIIRGVKKLATPPPNTPMRSVEVTTPKRKISAAVRKKISLSAKARWAKVNAEKDSKVAGKKK